MKEKKGKKKVWRILLWCLAGVVVLGIGAAVYISRNLQGVSYSAVLYTVVLDGRRYGATSAKLCQTAGEDNVGEFLGEAQFGDEGAFRAYRYIGEDGTVTNDIIFPEGSQMVYMPHPTKYRIYFDHGEFLKVPDPCQYVVFTFIDHENDGSEDWLAKRMEQLAYIQKRTSEGAVKSVIYEREKLEAIAALLAELPAGEETASGEAEGDEKLCVMLEDGTEFTLHYHSSTGKLRLGESEFYPAGTAYWSLDREQRQQLEALIANEATVPEHNGSADWLQEQLANVVCLQIRQYSSPQRPLEEVLPEYEVMQPGEQLEELAALLGSLPVRPKAELSQMYIDMFGDKVPPMMGRVTVGADGELSGSEKWILHEEGRKDMRRLDFVKADGEVVSVMYFPVMKAFSAQKAAFFLTEEQVAGVNALLGI